MRVQMLRTMCSPEHGNHTAGAIVDLPDDVARKRIEAGDCAPAEDKGRRLRDRLRGRGGSEPTPPPEDKPVGKMTVPELKKYADEHGIDLGDAEKKNDILARIEAAQDSDD